MSDLMSHWVEVKPFPGGGRKGEMCPPRDGSAALRGADPHRAVASRLLLFLLHCKHLVHFWRRGGASHRAPFCGAARPAQLCVPHAGEQTLAVSRCFTWVSANRRESFSPANAICRVSAAVQVLSRGKPSPAQLLRVLQTRCLCSAGRRLPVTSGFCAASVSSLTICRHLHTQPPQLHPSKNHFSIHFSLVSKLTCCSAQGFF